MHVTPPPEGSPAEPPGAPGTLPLRLGSCRHVLLPPGEWEASEDDRRTVTRHYEEMLALYGVSLPFTELAGDHRNTYADLGAAVIQPDTDGADMLMLAYSTPDYDARRSATSELVGLLGDRPLPYLVSDEGTVAPFTALRLAGAHARWDATERVLLLIMDQAGTRPVGPVPPSAVVDQDSVVALTLVRSADPAGMRVRQATGIVEAHVPAALAEAVKELVPSAAPYSLVLGAGLAGLPDPAEAGEVLRARPGLGCTGAWATLAEHATRLLDGGRPVVLAEYDPEYEFLALAVLAGS
ncbi:hypothetical protein N5079_34100 [Planotetraspora sp. A-T 1434]|uniref:hypothetical protein n=1 Tax=Planotetraspora sp. A-T 1434 TaxID=2979219 RepID=UPI0021C11FAB|nr:hypothetical protein [Planotetraspora sp. A-T 1434]MCT9935247.1 hypothetical protein [Planotetraspora sp. A-T 1434]